MHRFSDLSARRTPARTDIPPYNPRSFLNQHFPKSRRSPGLARSALAALLAIGGFAGHAGAAPLADQAPAEPHERWELVLSPFAYHWSDTDAHRHVYLVGLERKHDDGTLVGASFFRNSFGQPSAYAYYGKQWDNMLDRPELYFKLSGGVIYGYKGEYAHKVPFNHHGFGLAVIPAAGWKFDANNAVQVAMLGSAALIFTYNHGF